MISKVDADDESQHSVRKVLNEYESNTNTYSNWNIAQIDQNIDNHMKITEDQGTGYEEL